VLKRVEFTFISEYKDQEIHVGPSIPDPGLMGIAIGFSLLLLVTLTLLSRVKRGHSNFSYLTNAMLGGVDILKIRSTTKQDAIAELASHASQVLRWPDEETIKRGLLEREDQMSTGLEAGIAVPHARFMKLGRSLVLFARSDKGIDWDCMDGGLAHIIFLILTPEEDDKAQLKMLAELSNCAENVECRSVFQSTDDCREVVNAILKVVKSS
jgi:mannitol/fructose-specific phosphotransferase system IIA component (Ntr-type)